MTLQEIKELPFDREFKVSKSKYYSIIRLKTRLEYNNLGFLKIRKTTNFLFFKRVIEKPIKEYSLYKRTSKKSIDKQLLILRERYLNGEYKPKSLEKYNIDFSLSNKEICEQTGLTKQRISQLRIITNNLTIFKKYSYKTINDVKEYFLKNYDFKDGFYVVDIFSRNKVYEDLKVIGINLKTHSSYVSFLRNYKIDVKFQSFNLRDFVNFKLPNKVLEYIWGKSFNVIGGVRNLYRREESKYNLYFIDIRPGISSIEEQIKILCNIDSQFNELYKEEIKKINKLKQHNII